MNQENETPIVHLAGTGPDAATARLNSGGDAMKQVREDAAYEALSPVEKFAAWAGDMRIRLGLSKLGGDVPNDNAKLQEGLRLIAASGAPDPIRMKNIVAFPGDPSLSMVTELLVFTHFNNPRLQYSADELLVAINPQIVINDLANMGIRRQ